MLNTSRRIKLIHLDTTVDRGQHRNLTASVHTVLPLTLYGTREKLHATPALRDEHVVAQRRQQQALARADVDVVILNNAPPLLYHRVLKDGVRLVARDLPATTTREGAALSRYYDYLPQLAKIEAAHRLRTGSGEFGR